MKKLILGIIIGIIIGASGISISGVLSPAVDTDKVAIRDTAITMIATLDTIQSDVVGSNITASQQAIKVLAANQEKIIKFLVRNL